MTKVSIYGIGGYWDDQMIAVAYSKKAILLIVNALLLESGTRIVSLFGEIENKTVSGIFSWKEVQTLCQ